MKMKKMMIGIVLLTLLVLSTLVASINQFKEGDAIYNRVNGESYSNAGVDYSIFKAGDGETFIFIDGSWRQVAKKMDNSWSLQKKDNTFTDKVSEADTSSVLKNKKPKDINSNLVTDNRLHRATDPITGAVTISSGSSQAKFSADESRTLGLNHDLLRLDSFNPDGTVTGKLGNSDVTITRTGDILKKTVTNDPSTPADESDLSVTIWTRTGASQTGAQAKQSKITYKGTEYYVLCVGEKSGCFDETTGEGNMYKSPGDVSAGRAVEITDLKSYGYDGVGTIDYELNAKQEITKRTITFGPGSTYDCNQVQRCSGVNEDGESARFVQDKLKNGRQDKGTEGTFYDPSGFPIWNEEHSSAVDSTREYNSQYVGIFSYIDRGVGICKSSVCTNYYFSEDGDYVGTDWIDHNRDGKVQAGELPGRHETDEKGMLAICNTDNKDDSCFKTVNSADNDQMLGNFFAGRQEWQQDARAVLGASGRWGGISYALTGGDSLLGDQANKYVEGIDKWFAGSVLNAEYTKSLVCNATYEDLQGNGVGIIQSATGLNQVVASIQAERSNNKVEMLCMPSDNEEETDLICDDGYECRDGFCYNENTDEMGKTYLYKITWGVTAPQDDPSTPYYDEDSIVATFNVCYDNGQLNPDLKKCLYKVDGLVNLDAIKLKNGRSSDQDVFVHYFSGLPIKEFCIHWQDAPTTYAPGADEADYQIGDVCTDVVITEQGSVDFGTSSPGRTVSGGQVERNRDWK
jgi:hypothetical protein